MRSIVLAVLAMALALPALAGDGRLEISQTCAVNAGCFTGDATGFPVTIDGSAGGSYVLTSDLIIGDVDLDGIEVLVDDVTIDLNGFLVLGAAVCAGSPPAISCTAGTGVGILGSANGTVIHGGNVAGFAAGGIAVGAEARVDRIRASDNGGDGISTGDGSSILGSRSSGNYGSGVATGAGAQVKDNVLADNNGAAATGGAGTSYRGNLTRSNGGGALVGGVILSDNLCEGFACTASCTDVDSDTYFSDCDPLDCDDTLSPHYA